MKILLQIKILFKLTQNQMSDRTSEYKDAHERKRHNKRIKVSVISTPDTISNPRAVMIKSILNKQRESVHNKVNGMKFKVSMRHLPTQLSQMLQWEALGGRNILQVKQNFNFTTWPHTTTSFALGGGRYVGLLGLLGTSVNNKTKQQELNLWSLKIDVVFLCFFLWKRFRWT